MGFLLHCVTYSNMETTVLVSPLLQLPPELLNPITRLLDPSSLFRLAVLAGNSTLTRVCRDYGGIHEICIVSEAQTKTPALLRNLIAPLRHLTRLQCGKLAKSLSLHEWTKTGAWIQSLPPTLLEISLFCADPIGVWLRPLDDANDSAFVKQYCQVDGQTAVSLRNVCPKLHSLFLWDRIPRTSRPAPFFAFFLAHLPSSLTKLRMPLYHPASPIRAVLPPLAILQNLVEYRYDGAFAPPFCVPNPSIFDKPQGDGTTYANVDALFQEVSPERLLEALPGLDFLTLNLSNKQNDLVDQILPGLKDIHSVQYFCMQNKLDILFSRDLPLPFPPQLRLLYFTAPIAFEAAVVARFLTELPLLEALQTRVIHNSAPAQVTQLPRALERMRIGGDPSKLRFCPFPPTLTRLCLLDRRHQYDIDLSKCTKLTELELNYFVRGVVAKSPIRCFLPFLSTLILRNAVFHLPILKLLPPTLSKIQIDLRLIQPDVPLLETLIEWSQVSVLRRIRDAYLPQFPLEELTISVGMNRSFQLGMSKSQFVDYETGLSDLHLEPARGRAFLPASLTRYVTNRQINHLLVEELPPGLTELRLESSSWRIPGETRKSARRKTIRSIDLATAISDPKYMLPANLKHLETRPRFVKLTGTSYQLRFFPLLETAPALTTLSLQLPAYDIPTQMAILHLPPTITDLTILNEHVTHPIMFPAGVASDLTGWLPNLTAFKGVHVHLLLSEWIPRLPTLKTIFVCRFAVVKSLTDKLPQPIQNRDHAVRDTFLPEHLRECTVEYRFRW